jgi:beta-N-acetylhexosaminidase
MIAAITIVILVVTVDFGARKTSPPTVRHPPSNIGGGTHELPPIPTISRMLGQMIVARFAGSQPSSSLLARIRAGEVGGVILFADNTVGGPVATRALTARLQRAARRGGNPPLLIMTDQEGGEVKRLPGPPTMAPSQMTTTAVAFAQGRATGHLLRSVGITVDLAPVADVERVPNSFLGTRSFGHSPAVVSERACAFAAGLASQDVAYTLKHFPGLGRAATSTDAGPVSIGSDPAILRLDYAAYRSCGANPLALVMVSNATYPTLSADLPAVMSPEIYGRELSLAIDGFHGVTISDDLQAPAITSHQAPARHAINAGLDLAVYAQTETASTYAFAQLLKGVARGALSRQRIRAADREILLLKRRLGP